MQQEKRDTTRNISCSISFSSTFLLISRNFEFLFDSVDYITFKKKDLLFICKIATKIFILGESIHDLIPAGLARAGDTMAVVEPKYSTIGRHWNTQPWVGTGTLNHWQEIEYSAIGRIWNTQPLVRTRIHNHYQELEYSTISRNQNTQPLVGTRILNQWKELEYSTIGRNPILSHW